MVSLECIVLLTSCKVKWCCFVYDVQHLERCLKPCQWRRKGGGGGGGLGGLEPPNNDIGGGGGGGSAPPV